MQCWQEKLDAANKWKSYLHVLESSARPKLELDESRAAAFRANVFSLLQWSLPFFFYKENRMLCSSCETTCFTNLHKTIVLITCILHWHHWSVLYTGTFQAYMKVTSCTKQSHICCFTITILNFVRKKTNLFTAWNWDPLIDFHCCLTNCHPLFFPENERIQMWKLIRRLLYIDTYTSYITSPVKAEIRGYADIIICGSDITYLQLLKMSMCGQFWELRVIGYVMQAVFKLLTNDELCQPPAWLV